MHKFLAISLLALIATAATAQQTPPAQQPATAQTPATAPQPATAQQPANAEPAAPPQQIVIKNQAEYQAYTNASSAPDPAQKAQLLEAFLQQYPESVVKKQALESLLAAYQAAGNQQKLADTAQRILQVEPDNEQAAIVVAFVKTTQAQQEAAKPNANQQQVTQMYADAAAVDQTALKNLDKLQKPANVDDAAFQKQKDQIAVLLHSTIGNAAYRQENYDGAIQPLFEAIKLKPDDFSDMYELGVALAKPVKTSDMSNPQSRQRLMEGVFWLAKAASIAPAQAKQQFTATAQYYYKRYHGSADGFDAATQQAASMPAPGPGFQVTPAPSPQEQIAQLLTTNTTPDSILQLGFDTWSTIFTYGQPADQQKVWAVINGKKLELQGTVIQATNQQIQLAVSTDAVNDKRADVTVNLAAPMDTPPAVGAADYPVVGVADSYAAQPAFMLTLKDGASNVKTAKPAAKKTTTPAKRTHRTPR